MDHVYQLQYIIVNDYVGERCRAYPAQRYAWSLSQHAVRMYAHAYVCKRGAIGSDVEETVTERAFPWARTLENARFATLNDLSFRVSQLARAKELVKNRVTSRTFTRTFMTNLVFLVHLDYHLMGVQNVHSSQFTYWEKV